jgi:hypothetical protein
MPLSQAEKQRRYRERKREEVDARRRTARGEPVKAPEPEVPDGAWMGVNCLRPQAGWYEPKRGVFRRIPQGLLDETYTTPDGQVLVVPEQHARFLAMQGRKPFTAGERERRMKMTPKERLSGTNDDDDARNVLFDE